MKLSAQDKVWNSEPRLRATNLVLTLAIVSLAALIAPPSALAQTYSVLYSFKPQKDAYNPVSDVIRDSRGVLYGTTPVGGSHGAGTVFKVSATGEEKVLYSFKGGTDGQSPQGGLIRDALGNLYGTTSYGGDGNSGTVFRIGPLGETVLYRFGPAGSGDGAHPAAGLARDADGNLYGTTLDGGAFNGGSVFKLMPRPNGKWVETVLYSFGSVEEDGAHPQAGVVRDAAGNLYGTTPEGGASQFGTVFKLDPMSNERVLHSFAGSDGSKPYAGLILDRAGNLYGTTREGGVSGSGVVFRLDTTGVETVLYSFAGAADGEFPEAGLVRDASGNLYGTTFLGGDSNNGVVFKVDGTGAESVLHAFTGNDGDPKDGAHPQASLFRDAKGHLYGTTRDGGDYGCCKGVVFQLKP